MVSGKISKKKIDLFGIHFNVLLDLYFVCVFCFSFLCDRHEHFNDSNITSILKRTA